MNYSNFRNAKIIKVIKVEVNEGNGTPEDPIVRVVYLTSLEGKLLAKIGDEGNKRVFAGEDEMIKFNQ